MAAINLHKFGIVPDEDDSTHVFSFIFENPQRLVDGGAKAIESSEVNYNGQKWSVVCMKKDERYMGFFLKWKYGDGQSASSTSCKAKYRLCLTHRSDYNENKYFSSNQKFSSSQTLLGKSKFVPLDELLHQGAGYLDETGKRVVLELTMFQCVTRFEQQVGVLVSEVGCVCHSVPIARSQIVTESLTERIIQLSPFVVYG